MTRGRAIEATVEGVVRGLGALGDGAVFLPDGSIVFARGVLPGERVRIEGVDGGRVRRARAVEVIDRSPERVDPPCVYVSACGGCPIMHASERLQSAIKLERVRRALAPVAADVAIDLASPALRLGYRRRARLAFARGEGGIAIGYRAESSRRVVDIERCLVLAPVLEAALRLTRDRVAPHLVGTGELRLGALGERATMRIETRDAQPPSLYAALDALVAQGSIAGAALLAGGASAPARFGEDHEQTVDAEGRVLRAPLGGFGQAHAEHNRALASRALDDAVPNGARALELFAGHGNFTLALASRAASTIAVELDGEAARCLVQNLASHDLRARVVVSDAAVATRALARSSVDVVLLDPPREGAPDMMAALVALAPLRVVYVSCNPESLARDAAMLVAGGYALVRAHAVDMFPETAHVEVVARFDRRQMPAKQVRSVAPAHRRR